MLVAVQCWGLSGFQLLVNVVLNFTGDCYGFISQHTVTSTIV